MSRSWDRPYTPPHYPDSPYAPPRTTIIDAEVVDGDDDRPVPPRRPAIAWRKQAVLLVATFVSLLYVGSDFSFNFAWDGWLYALSLITILGCHEAGHYIAARRYHVPASLPFFIPIPFSPIGTLGAVIGMDARIPNRRALFDIGIAGPLAGLVPTIIFTVLGLMWSEHTSMRQAAGDLFIGPSVLFVAMIQQFVPPGSGPIDLHPFAYAGWVGMLITALNLLPIGQLDGGHVLYGMLEKRAHGVANAVLIGAIVIVALMQWYWWWMMIFLLILMGPMHAPTQNDDVRIGWYRYVLGWATLCFMPLGFPPIPFLGM